MFVRCVLGAPLSLVWWLSAGVREEPNTITVYMRLSLLHTAVHLVLQVVSSPLSENNPPLCLLTVLTSLLCPWHPPQQPSLLLPHLPATALWTILSVQNPQNPGPVPLCLVFSWFHCNKRPYTDFLAYDATGSTIFALSLWLPPLQLWQTDFCWLTLNASLPVRQSRKVTTDLKEIQTFVWQWWA